MTVFWQSDTCTIWCEYTDAGALVFHGVDRGHLDGSDYEYVITVEPAEFAAVRSALGGATDDDVLGLACLRVASIMTRGERTWLDEHHIGYTFGNY